MDSLIDRKAEDLKKIPEDWVKKYKDIHLCGEETKKMFDKYSYGDYTIGVGVTEGISEKFKTGDIVELKEDIRKSSTIVITEDKVVIK